MDDAALLQAIAKRDQQAFSDLYQRHESAVFSLAVSITGSALLAEEAVQNALLRIWTSAASFQPGNARGWILCVVARESLKVAQARQREHKKQMNYEDAQYQSTNQSAPEAVEQEELSTALRGSLQRLSAVDRQFITLYFVGGLSQDEIAKETSTPRQTVSRHIQDALQFLKGDLATSGFAAAVPLVSAEGLRQVCCSGHVAPPGLREKVLSGLSRPIGQVSRRLSRRAPVAKAGSTGLLIAGLSVAVIAGGAWLLNTNKPPAPPPVAHTPAAPVVETPAAAPLPVPQWEPLTDDFHTVLGQAKGTWQAEKSPNGLALTFTPAPGEERQRKSYCYVGHNFSESRELRGTLEHSGTESIGYIELGICHPNRTNCSNYVLKFEKGICPLTFRLQARFEKKGLRVALSITDANGREHASMAKIDSWYPQPWQIRVADSKIADVKALSSDGTMIWHQHAFEQMRECGFSIVTSESMRISSLQQRPLIDSEWRADLLPENP